MKLRLLTCMLLTCIAVPVFAEEINIIPAQLFLVPEQASWSRPSLASSQMTVTPTSAVSFNYILARIYTSNDTSCSSGSQTFTLTNSVATTLNASQPYITSNASNFYLFGNGAQPNNDVDFFFSNDNVSNVGSFSPCGTIECINAGDCGFVTNVTWNWTP